MKIQVNQKHIDIGVRGSEFYCPVALALKEQIKKVSGTSVGDYIRLTDKDGVPRLLETPGKVFQFTLKFDLLQKVAPFSFELPDDFTDFQRADGLHPRLSRDYIVPVSRNSTNMEAF